MKEKNAIIKYNDTKYYIALRSQFSWRKIEIKERKTKYFQFMKKKKK